MARSLVVITPIRPKRMKIAQYRKGIENAVEFEARTIEALYRNVSDGFSTPVTYVKTRLKKRSSFGIRVATKDIRMVSLDLGTSKRWAVMSDDFVPKTIPGRLSSRGGSGRAVIRGRRAMSARNIRPRPGIKARKFSEEIVKTREREFPQRVQRAIDLAAKKTY
jgi:hypothetical protein